MIRVTQQYDIDNVSCSSSHSIASWLENHPRDPYHYAYNEQENENENRSKTGTRKRKQSSRHLPSRHLVSASKRQKFALSNITVNTMPPQSPTRSSRRRSPAKSRNDLPYHAIEDPSRTPSPTSRTKDATPTQNHPSGRVSRLDLSQVPSLPRNHQGTSGTASNTSSSLPQGSTNSNRSRSPTKYMADLELADIPVRKVALGPAGHLIPPVIAVMFRNLASMNGNDGVVPKTLADRVKQHVKDFEPFLDRHIAKEAVEEDVLGGSAYDSLWDNIKDIEREGVKCQDTRASESAWNLDVHGQVFRLALRPYWTSHGISLKDITSARITDQSLLPTVNDTIMKSKMVDFAITIEPAPKLRNAIRAKIKADEQTSINHSNAEDLRFSPIAISIETKRPGEGGDTGDIQLGIWAYAHFAKLRQLTGGREVLSVLPMIIVQGHDWRLMCAQQVRDEEGELEIEILDGAKIGDTRSVLGIFRAVASIRVLAKWANEDYKPWFTECVLGRKVGSYH